MAAATTASAPAASRAPTKISPIERADIAEFYRIWNPEKLPEMNHIVDTIEQRGGTARETFAALYRKYNVKPVDNFDELVTELHHTFPGVTEDQVVSAIRMIERKALEGVSAVSALEQRLSKSNRASDWKPPKLPPHPSGGTLSAQERQKGPRFLPPHRQPDVNACWVQFAMYLRWLTSFGIFCGSTSENASLATKTVAQFACNELKCGLGLLQLLDKLMNDPTPSALPPGPTSAKRGPPVTPAAAIQNFAVINRVLVQDCGIPESALPQPKACVTGRFDVISQMLFLLYHAFVVREKVSLFQPMMEWYHRIATIYRIPATVKKQYAPTSSTLSEIFRDGVVWIALFHNITTKPQELELTTVYFDPQNDVQIMSNLCLLYSLFQLYSMTPVFSDIRDVALHNNEHFLFVQAVALFERFADVPLRDIDPLKLCFADKERLSVEREVREERVIRISPSPEPAGPTGMSAAPAAYIEARNTTTAVTYRMPKNLAAAEKAARKSWTPAGISAVASGKKRSAATSSRAITPRPQTAARHRRELRAKPAAPHGAATTPAAIQQRQQIAKSGAQTTRPATAYEKVLRTHGLLRYPIRRKGGGEQVGASATQPQRKGHHQDDHSTPSLYHVRFIGTMTGTPKMDSAVLTVDSGAERVAFSFPGLSGIRAFSVQLKQVKSCGVTPVVAGAVSSVVIHCSGQCEDAPPPYNITTDPSVTLLIATADDAVALHLELSRACHFS